MTVNVNKDQSEKRTPEQCYKENVASLTEHVVGLGVFGLLVEGVGYYCNSNVMYGLGFLIATGSAICLYDRQKAISEHKKDCTPK